MSISSTGRAGLRGRLRLAARQVIGHHRIVVIPLERHTEWWRASYAAASATGEVDVGRTTLEDV